ncbi:MAG: hypothetical protein JST05_09305 [Acidobacteria bacterium]|nr:hypothetical protein [Acidobacteriota bacterium]
MPTQSGATFAWTVTGGALLDGQGTSAITIQPDMGFSGIHITCTTTKGGASANGTADVTPVLPIANAQSANATSSVDTPLTLAGSDSFSDPITYSVVAAPAHGTLTGTAPNVVYTSGIGYSGADSFTFRVTDSYGNQSIPSTVTLNVLSPASVYVSTSGSDANDGLTLGTSFATIQHAIDSLGSGAYAAISTVVVEPGTYAENLSIHKSLTLRGDGPVSSPADPQVRIQPAVVTGTYPPSGTTYGLINIGVSSSDTSEKGLVVNLENLAIDGSAVYPTNPQVRGVQFFYASGSIKNCVIENLGATAGVYGVQDGLPVYMWGTPSQPGQWTIQDSLLRDFNKQAFGDRGTGTITLTNNRLSGMGAASPSQQSQNFLFLWDDISLNAQNNIFENLGPAGGPGRLVATDESTGTALGIVADVPGTPVYYPRTEPDGTTYSNYGVDRSTLQIQGNTFVNCQTTWYDTLYVGTGGTSLGAITNSQILANNTVLGGYISEGPLNESPYLSDFAIMPGSAGPYDNMLQYVLKYRDTSYYSTNEVFISPGTFDLPSDVTSVQPVVLRSAVAGQPVTITLPSGSTHSNVTAGDGVVITIRP